ncbi:TraR/DksA C4-type zinc finger protein [Paenibacillus sepulcri]|uniref:TraR/DksA C4-type zinc finger protein n=1 Tax=Paenibacillus sepulcri TaxID=359917 RepID=A0ABS7C2H7_9BACL|nr:TraR/DksA C4-type zinc finger protein [Paenibacillus sepulcri]
MNTLTMNQLNMLRSQLEAEKNETARRLEDSDHYGHADSQRDETGELSMIDNHPGDVASEIYERGKDTALLEQEELRLERIEAALTAMDNGVYGSCLVCGEAIPYQRLQALPDTLYCVEHSPRQEISERRPIEEQVLTPAFGHSSMDEHEGYNGFDGEDAWQIVEQWGNSDSPAMSENRDVESYDEMGVEAGEPDGYVEPLESFLATDITGKVVSVVRNREYYDYLKNNEGDSGLE